MKPQSLVDEETNHDLVFPDKLQFSYATKTITCVVDKLKILTEDKEQMSKFEDVLPEIDYGRSNEFQGVNLIFEPEKYVDTGIKLKQLIQVINKNGDYMKNWSSIIDSPTGHHYYVTQDWHWIETV